MEFGLTDDQQLFHETTAKFLEDTCPIDAVHNGPSHSGHTVSGSGRAMPRIIVSA